MALPVQQMSSVADCIIELWLSEVRALKQSKRPKWKGVMHNQTGCNSVVRYVPDGVCMGGQTTYFVHKLSQERQAKRGTSETWLPVFSFTARAAIQSELDTDYTRVIMRTVEGARPVVDHEPQVAYAGEGPVVARDQDEIRALIEEQIRANATGNHTARNRPIRVPTATGQPVRG